MPVTTARARIAILLAFTALLIACSSGGPSRGRLEHPRPLRAADYPAPGIPASFGDTKPNDWGPSPPVAYPIHGIDASRYQGEINWYQARAAGVNFAWLKATEGGDHIDSGFAINAPRARAAGVPVGGYHFYYFCRTAREQAEWFIKNVPHVSGDLPPVLDMEWNYQSRTCPRRPDAATVRDDIRTFARIVTRAYGTPPLVYVTPDFYADNDLGSMTGTEFWLRSVAGIPSERYPGERWTIWQYTGTGVVPGVDGHVDINAFAGDAVSWLTWLGERRQP